MRRPIRFVAVVAIFVWAQAFTCTGFGDRASAARPDLLTQEANITRLTTSLLERSQFSRHAFDDKLADTLLDRYQDSLDATRSLFLQSDVAELAPYRTTLAKATRQSGDTTAARAIFARYLVRLEQQVTYVTELLKQPATFDFSGEDTYSFDREHAKRPTDIAAAQARWKQELRAEYLQEKLRGKAPEKIATALNHRYTQQLSTMKALGSGEVLEVYLDTLAHVYDPHSDYMGHDEMENFSISMKLSLVGIGASLENADGYCKVHELIAGGPAAKSGLLKPGDRIVSVAQAGKEPVDIVNMPLNRAVELIRGQKGTTVTLSVIPAGAADASVPKTLALVRDEIKLEDQAAKASILDLPGAAGDKAATFRVGVIDLPSFYADPGDRKGAGGRSATADVARLVKKLRAEHVRGVVLDLRRNGGGSLAEAISLTGLFIPKGPVVQTRDQSGDIDVGTDDDATVQYDGPLVLLTSRFSASASEIVAGALQDYGRALVVGDSATFGKGTVQTILPLARVMDQVGLAYASDPGALKITINKFYRPSGASTQLRGVASDIVLPSTSDLSDVSEAAQKNALPWDVVPAAPFQKLNRVKPFLEQLRQSSDKRVATDTDFAYLGADIARLKRTLATKSVSLNEGQRRKELADDKARHEEHAREAKKLRATRPTKYEITLANVASPGLPAPWVPKEKPKPEPAADAKADTKVDAAASDLDEAAPDQVAADDIILNEGVRILADYVDLLATDVKPTTRNAQLTPNTHTGDMR